MIQFNKAEVPLLGELTAENENTYYDRKLDMVFFGLEKGDWKSMYAISEAVKD